MVKSSFSSIIALSPLTDNLPNPQNAVSHPVQCIKQILRDGGERSLAGRGVSQHLSLFCATPKGRIERDTLQSQVWMNCTLSRVLWVRRLVLDTLDTEIPHSLDTMMSDIFPSRSVVRKKCNTTCFQLFLTRKTHLSNDLGSLQNESQRRICVGIFGPSELKAERTTTRTLGRDDHRGAEKLDDETL